MCKQCNENPVIGRKFKNPEIWEPTKECSRCGESKAVYKAYRSINLKRKDGTIKKSRKSTCLTCEAGYASTRYATDMETRAAKMVNTSYHRSLKKGINHDLTTEWVLERLERGVCEVTGITLQLEGGKIDGGHRSFTASLDRVDNTKGYTMDNVKVVCWIYNSAKGVGTHEDVMKLVEALANV